MAQDDPFGLNDPERTRIARPQPGGRGPAYRPRRRPRGPAAVPPLPEGTNGRGPLVQAAFGLLMLAPRLRSRLPPSDPAAAATAGRGRARPIRGSGARARRRWPARPHRPLRLVRAHRRFGAEHALGRARGMEERKPRRHAPPRRRRGRALLRRARPGAPRAGAPAAPGGAVGGLSRHGFRGALPAGAGRLGHAGGHARGSPAPARRLGAGGAVAPLAGRGRAAHACCRSTGLATCRPIAGAARSGSPHDAAWPQRDLVAGGPAADLRATSGRRWPELPHTGDLECGFVSLPSATSGSFGATRRPTTVCTTRACNAPCSVDHWTTSRNEEMHLICSSTATAISCRMRRNCSTWRT